MRITPWLPPLGYSPQFAAFNRILFAVGHRVLQHFYVLMVDNSVTRSHFIAKRGCTKPKRHIVYQPDKGQILSRFLQTCTAKSAFIKGFESRFDGEPQALDELIRITFQNRTVHSQVTVFWAKKWGNHSRCPILSSDLTDSFIKL